MNIYEWLDHFYVWQKLAGVRRTVGKALHWKILKQRAEHTVQLSQVEIPTRFRVEQCETAQIAVHAHVFYPDLMAEVLEAINHIPFLFDVYLSTDTEEKKQEIQRFLDKNKCNAQNIQVMTIKNQGRDVWPLLAQMSPVIHKYEYLCHIHTKKSNFSKIGNEWRRYLYHGLLGSERIVKQHFALMEKEKRLGLLFPATFDAVWYAFYWDGNLKHAQKLAERMKFEQKLPEDVIYYPAGDMFWARTDAIDMLFECNMEADDFPPEAPAIDGTVMHAIERLWVYIAREKGYTFWETTE